MSFWSSATLLMPITTTNKNKLIYRMKNPSFLGWGFTEDYSCACTIVIISPRLQVIL